MVYLIRTLYLFLLLFMGKIRYGWRDFTLLFKFFSVPIPMAIVPILAFGFIAIWGKSGWLGIVTVLFSIGHIVNSWHTYSSIK